jgi:nicotinamide-nucleotide amidase
MGPEGSSDAELAALARRLGDRLHAAGLSFAAAESCTGGWIAKLATDVAGSSEWFERGLVTYSNRAKEELLGVPEALIVAQGAVSEPVVRAMVEGLLARCPAELAVAVSGIAGPGGGSAEKPVGTVWLAWGRRGGAVRSRRECFAGDREGVRRQAAAAALSGLLELAGA